MRRVTAAAALAVIVAALHPAPAHQSTMRVARFVALTGDARAAASREASTSSAGRGTRTARYTVDAPDVVRGNQTHIVYFVPKDRRDERLDVSGAIAGSVGSMVAWFKAQAGRAPRMDLRKGGVLDVTFVRGRKDAAEYETLDDVSGEILTRGIGKAGKRFLVYAAIPTGGVCGEAEYPIPPLDDGLGSFSAVYLDSTPACGSREFGNGTLRGAGRAEVITAQEWLHNEGIVPLVAPHECTAVTGGIPIPFAVAHVCTGPLMYLEGLDPEEIDVMFPLATGLRLSQKVLDRGHDDYFMQPQPTIDLADSTWMQ